MPAQWNGSVKSNYFQNRIGVFLIKFWAMQFYELATATVNICRLLVKACCSKENHWFHFHMQRQWRINYSTELLGKKELNFEGWKI